MGTEKPYEPCLERLCDIHQLVADSFRAQHDHLWAERQLALSISRIRQ